MPFHMLVFYTYYLCVFHNYTDDMGIIFLFMLRKWKSKFRNLLEVT